MSSLTSEKLARYIDHTILKATATQEDISKLCAEARQYNFASVCVNPCFVKTAAKLLEGSEVKVCTVIGFPLGANTSETKAFEAAEAVKNGAEEVDMVINVGAAKAGDWQTVENDIKAVVDSVPNNVCTKVILETCYLEKEEIIKASETSRNAKACFVKTSTGFGTDGATTENVAIMKQTVGDKLKVKASGGIRSYESAIAMIEAGAERLGTSSGIAIVEAAK